MNPIEARGWRVTGPDGLGFKRPSNHVTLGKQEYVTELQLAVDRS